MGVFGAFFGCIGVVGFNGRCLGASIGDGGFMLACISGRRGVIGFKVPMGGGPEREKVCPARSQHPKFGVFALAGRSFSRKRGWRPAAGRVFSRAGSRGPGCWALLLAVLTLQCAAKPHWWHGGQPAHATTHRVNVHRMRSQKWGLLGSQASAPPGIRQRRDPEGSRLSLRAVAAPSAPISQRQKLSARAAAR